MDKVSLSIIIDRLKQISYNMYEENTDLVDASYELDKVIDELNGWLEILDKEKKDD